MIGDERRKAHEVVDDYQAKNLVANVEKIRLSFIKRVSNFEKDTQFDKYVEGDEHNL